MKMETLHCIMLPVVAQHWINRSPSCPLSRTTTPADYRHDKWMWRITMGFATCKEFCHSQFYPEVDQVRSCKQLHCAVSVTNQPLLLVCVRFPCWSNIRILRYEIVVWCTRRCDMVVRPAVLFSTAEWIMDERNRVSFWCKTIRHFVHTNKDWSTLCIWSWLTPWVIFLDQTPFLQ